MKRKTNKIKLFLVAFGVIFVGLLGFYFVAPERNIGTCPAVQAASDFQGKMDSTTQSVESRGLVPCTLSECTFCHLLQLIERIFFWLLTLAFAVAVLFVVISGFAYILSVGDSSMMSWAKEGLVYAIVGFVICIVSWLAIHVLYIVLGYGDNWWQIQCAQQSSSYQSESQNQVSSSKYINEVPLTDVGGRNNPVSLPSLSQKDIAALPENQYFFIHGIGGQPLKEAAKQVAKAVVQAEQQKKVVYAAVPYYDNNDQITGVQKINLNNYLTSELRNNLVSIENNSSTATTQDPNTILNNDSKSLDNFYNALLSMLTKSVSDEIPLIMAKKGITPADFSQKWPTIDWNNLFANNFSEAFKPLKTNNSGLVYQEGNGPVLYDPERYDGQIPLNDTHVDINLNSDGSLDLSNPITISKVAPGVSTSELKAYADEIGDLLSDLTKQSKIQGNKGEIATSLVKILHQPQSSTDNNAADTQEQTKPNTNFNSSQPVTLDNLNTGGAGTLPSGIVSNLANNKPISNKDIQEIERQIQELLKTNQSSSTGPIGPSSNDSSGSSNNSGSSSNNTGNGNTSTGSGNTSGTSNTGNTGNNTGNTGNTSNTGTSGNNSDYSGSTSTTTLGLKGQLSRDEIKRLDEEIIPKDLNDLSLNVPVDFVMCLIKKESAFKPSAFNGNGERSIGLMQLNTRVGTQKAALQGLKSYANNNDQSNIYLKLRRDVGTDQVLTSDAGLLSQKDPANERGITNVSLGVGYLKLINAKNKRGDGLKNYQDLDNLAAGYNAGPAGAKSGNTAYSREVVSCTKSMQARRQASGGASPWLQDYDKRASKK